MKTKKFLLPCIAAVAIATFVGAKSFKTNAYESNDLLLANVEAMSNGSDLTGTIRACSEKGGGTRGDYSYICQSGTTLYVSAPPTSQWPVGATVKDCKAPKQIPKISLSSKWGYCVEY